MKMFLRFFLPLSGVLALIAYLTVPAVEYVTSRWFERDLEARSKMISDALQESFAPLLLNPGSESKRKMSDLISKITENERILAIGYCNSADHLEIHTSLFPKELECKNFQGSENHELILSELKNGNFHITTSPLLVKSEGSMELSGSLSRLPIAGRLLIVHDMSFAKRRTDDTKNYLFLLFLGVGLVTAILGVVVARWSMKGWIRSVRNLVTGAQSSDINVTDDKDFAPILQDVKNLIRELESNRACRDELQLSWTPVSLKEILSKELIGDEIIVLSNRQPYIHDRKDGKISVRRPASGLVTALEPVVRACSGVWIAHGNGTADREVVDNRSRLSVPPGKSEYELLRIWLSPEEEQGYYYGFANEGLWPLCHIAHTRPIFRQTDWDYYKQVNQKFADAVVASANSENPVVLVQDYHFALVPKMIRDKLPNAVVMTFWHVPWPNPESFGICPWREEILEGLLGSSTMGFHIRFHSNNFIETVERFLESRIDRESSSVSYCGRVCSVRSYPISIEWPPKILAELASLSECESHVRQKNNISSDVIIGLGVDRLDYTKGIMERFRSLERLFEKYPSWIGRFSFVQIAAPSRSSIAAYQALDLEVRGMVEQINKRFGFGEYLPIHLKVEHHTPEQVYQYMRSAKVCFVTSLHDGMNLVAKEYIAAREDELGVVILSMFAGASRELTESLIVNPYDIEQCADALNKALLMPQREQRERMHAMRSFIKEFNIYRWAGKMLIDAANIQRKNRFLRTFSR